MITSDKQYTASQKQLAMLQEAFTVDFKPNIPEKIQNAGKVQLQDLIDQVRAEIAEYESLKGSKVEDLKIHSIEDLLVAPIRYRIMSHMSVDAFSRKVGVSARQIHRYEAEHYSNVNTSTLKKILQEIHVNLDGNVAS